MAKFSIVFGIILIILGLVSYFGISSESITALIPAFLGLPMLILGWIAQNEKYLKHAMHGAAVLMLISIIGASVRILSNVSFNQSFVFSEPVIIQILMVLISLIFLILVVKSFFDSRKTKKLTK